jgi:hypothetical protein
MQIQRVQTAWEPPGGRAVRRATMAVGGIGRMLPPFGNTSIRMKLPDYWFRLPVMPKGSLFSILPAVGEVRALR